MHDRMYINVLIKEPNKNPKVKRIRNEIDRLNKILGGDFDLLEYDENSFIAYNYKSTSQNQIQIGKYLLKGTILVIGNNREECDFRTLTEEQIKEFSKELSVHNTKIIREESLRSSSKLVTDVEHKKKNGVIDEECEEIEI